MTSEQFGPSQAAAPAPPAGKQLAWDPMALAVGLLATILLIAAMGFFHLDNKIDVRFDHLDNKVDARFDRLDNKIDGVRQEIADVRQEVADLRTLVIERLPAPSQR